MRVSLRRCVRERRDEREWERGRARTRERERGRQGEGEEVRESKILLK